jgi:hypothetical protein
MLVLLTLAHWLPLALTRRGLSLPRSVVLALALALGESTQWLLCVAAAPSSLRTTRQVH